MSLAPSSAAVTALPARLVLFDGVCGFCSRSVQWVIAADARGAFSFAPLQGPTAAAILGRHPDAPRDLDTIVLVENADGNERLFGRSEAAFRIAAELPGWRWRAWTLFGLLPRFLTDLGYRLFAHVRYRLFGKLETCMVPSSEQRARFLP